MKTLPDKELLRPDEVADHFRVHRRTVYNWIQRDKVEATKVGTLVRIYRRSLSKKLLGPVL